MDNSGSSWTNTLNNILTLGSNGLKAYNNATSPTKTNTTTAAAAASSPTSKYLLYGGIAAAVLVVILLFVRKR